MAWRDHRLTPGVFTAMAQVTASRFWEGASGSRLPIHSSSAKMPPVASIFMPETTTPSSVSSTMRKVGIGKFCFS